MSKERVFWTVLPSGKDERAPRNLKFSVVVTVELIANGVDNELSEYENFIKWPEIVRDLKFTLNIETVDGMHSINHLSPKTIDLELGIALWKCYFGNKTPVRKLESELAYVDDIISFPEKDISNYLDRFYKFVGANIGNNTNDIHCFNEYPIVRNGSETVEFGKPLTIDLDKYVEQSPSILFKRIECYPEFGTLVEEYDNVGLLRSVVFTPTILEAQTTITFSVRTDYGKTSFGSIRIYIIDPNNPVHNDYFKSIENGRTASNNSQLIDLDKPCLSEVLINSTNIDILERAQAVLNKGEPLSASIPQTKLDFYKLQKFHKILSPKELPPSSSVTDGINVNLVPEMDFHQLIDNCHEYPAVMQRIGIRLDFSVDPEEIADDLEIVENGNVSISPEEPFSFESNSMLTRFVHTSNEQQRIFNVDWSSNPEYEGGMLNMNDLDFELVTKDIVGSAMKLQNNAMNASQTSDEDSMEQSETDRLDMIRTIGFSLIQKNRAPRYKKILEKSHNFNKVLASGIKLASDFLIHDVENLILGFRVDVYDSVTRKWNSLNRRNGVYSIENLSKQFKSDDEGFISVATSEPVSGLLDEIHTVQMGESIFKWNNWSLSVMPLGKTIGSESTPSDPSTFFGWLKEKNKLFGENSLKLDFSVPESSLPFLRFGVGYRFRLRIVDLAGNGLRLDDSIPDKYAFPANEIVYRRYEPVPSPNLVFKDHETAERPGETIETIVIRVDNSHGIIDFNNQVSIRHILPPKISQQLAEVHGMFDNDDWYDNSSSGDDADNKNYKKMYEKLVSKEKVLNPDNVEIGNQITAPYLPDPLAVSAVISNLPGEENIQKVEYEGKWPDLKSYQLKLSAGSINTSNNDRINRVLNIELTPGTMREITICSLIPNDKLDLMALYNLVSSDISFKKHFGALEKLKQLTNNGENWLLTPPKKLKIICAVNEPLSPATINIKTMRRELDQTGVVITGFITVNAKSVSKVNLNSENITAVYDSEKGFYKEVKLWDNPFEKTDIAYPGIDDSDDTDISIENYPHQLNCAKRVKVRYIAVCQSRYGEYYDEGTNLTLPSQAQEFDLPNTTRPEPIEIVRIIPTFRWVEDANSKIVARYSGMRIYVKPPWFSSGFGEQLGIVLMNENFIKQREKEKIEKLEKFVTLWGNDPVWRAMPLSGEKFPISNQVKNYSTHNSRVQLSELDYNKDMVVTVLGYELKFDKDEKLLYCDVEIENKYSYSTFVNFALCRFQPHSLPGAHISTIDKKQFMQMLPNRFVSLLTPAEKPTQLIVMVSGIFPEGYNIHTRLIAVLKTKPRNFDKDIWIEITRRELGYHDKSTINKVGVWDFEFDLSGLQETNEYKLTISEYELYEQEKDSGYNIERRIYSKDIHI